MGKKKKKSKSGAKWKKILIAAGFILAAFTLSMGVSFYLKVYAPSLNVPEDDNHLYIPTGTNYDQLITILTDKKIVRSIEDFKWVANQMDLAGHVYPGRYKLEKNMSNRSFVALLRSGKQDPVKLVINKFRLKEDLAGFVSRNLEVDSADLVYSLNDDTYLRQFNIDAENSMGLFIPNTYEFYWNTNTQQFLKRMKKEYDRFWTPERLAQARSLELTPLQVLTLASIVEEETNYNDEKSRVAGVYINRVHNNMLLQADPTVKFAIKDFSIKRVLNTHLSYASPYNTYLNKGLPPGPICTPSIKTIDAVLNAEHHDYLYFCANPDKPGTHVFAKTYHEHQLNAKRYQKWITQRSGSI